MSIRLVSMEISNTEIAKCALCTEGAVRKAIVRGRVHDCESLLAFCLSVRMRGGRVDVIDDLLSGGKLKTGADFETASDEPEYVRDHEHDEIIL